MFISISSENYPKDKSTFSCLIFFFERYFFLGRKITFTCLHSDANITKHKTLFANHVGVKLALSTRILPRNGKIRCSRYGVWEWRRARKVQNTLKFVPLSFAPIVTTTCVTRVFVRTYLHARFSVFVYSSLLSQPRSKTYDFVNTRFQEHGVFGTEQQYYDIRSQ